MKKTQILEIFIDAYPIKRRRMLREKSVPRYNSYQIVRTIVELCDIGLNDNILSNYIIPFILMQIIPNKIESYDFPRMYEDIITT